MNRRQFVAAGLAGAVAHRGSVGQVPVQDPSAGLRLGAPIRKLFPRLGQEIFLNAAGGTPMGSFVESGLRRYEDFWRLGQAAIGGPISAR